jgi:ATPase subunit of ABC transporter with duplicated ATPase domains
MTTTDHQKNLSYELHEDDNSGWLVSEILPLNDKSADILKKREER